MTTQPETEMVECDTCGELFDIGQEGYDQDDEVYCSNCEWEHTYDCAICEDRDLESQQGNIGTVLIIDGKDEPINIPDGTYQIIRHPYYGGPLLGAMEIFPESVRRIGPVPADVYLDGYPVGHVCGYCGPFAIGESLSMLYWPWLFEV